MKKRLTALFLSLALLLTPALAALAGSGNAWTELDQEGLFQLSEQPPEDFFLVYYSASCGYSQKWVPQFHDYAESNHIPVYGADRMSVGSIPGFYFTDYSGGYPIVFQRRGGVYTVTSDVRSLEAFQAIVGGTIQVIEAEGCDIADKVLLRYHGDAAELAVPEGVTEVASGAFAGSDALREVTFPASLETVGGGLFVNCPQLQTVRFLGAMPAFSTEYGSFAFSRAAGIYPEEDPTWDLGVLQTRCPEVNWGGKPGQTQPLPARSAVDDGTLADWAAPETLEAISYGLVQTGLQKNYDQPITRAWFCSMAMALVTKATGKTADEIAGASDAVPFPDAGGADIRAAHALGLVNGRGDGTFDPEGTITRQEAAAMLARTARYLGVGADGAAGGFADAGDIAPWAGEDVGFVAALATPEGKTVMGSTGTGFSPLATYSRQEAVCSFLRLYLSLGEA